MARVSGEEDDGHSQPLTLPVVAVIILLSVGLIGLIVGIVWSNINKRLNKQAGFADDGNDVEFSNLNDEKSTSTIM